MLSTGGNKFNENNVLIYSIIIIIIIINRFLSPHAYNKIIVQYIIMKAATTVYEK